MDSGTNAKTYHTPGVYIDEKSAFPNPVVQVPTAIPVFLGYTQKADFNGQALKGRATMITSLGEYSSYFGYGPQNTCRSMPGESAGNVASLMQFAVSDKAPDPLPTIPDPSVEGAPTCVAVGVPNALIQTLALSTGTTPASTEYYISLNAAGNFYLYNSIRLFYLNGGGTAYIISLGDYSSIPASSDFKDALNNIVINYQEPTLIVMPDALLLTNAEYNEVMRSTLSFAVRRENLFCLLDVWGAGFANNSAAMLDAYQESFRTGVGEEGLGYGAAYFPWLQTTVIQPGEINFLHFKNADLDAYLEDGVPTAVMSQMIQAAATALGADPDMAEQATRDAVIKAHNTLYAGSPNYKQIVDTATRIANVLPAAAAMAGVYTTVDNNYGVWRPPANVSVAAVGPTVNLSDMLQAPLNNDVTSGKSINAIRSFTGRGPLVWGGRTMDGNDLEYRYINVRRTIIMIEQSIKDSLKAFVFEPNVANTWAIAQSAVDNFLFNLWKQGALVGAKPTDAYSVAVGLGSTMTAQDILDGYMKVEVALAMVRPAEFVVIQVQQQMQQS